MASASRLQWQSKPFLGGSRKDETRLELLNGYAACRRRPKKVSSHRGGSELFEKVLAEGSRALLHGGFGAGLQGQQNEALS